MTASGFVSRFKGKVFLVGASLFQAGNSGSSMGPSGNLNVQTSAITSSATNTLQTLMSYSLPANAFNQNGRGFHVEVWGKLNNNAAPKSVNLKFGGFTLASGTTTQANVAWRLSADVFRTGASAQIIIASGVIGSTVVALTNGTDTSVDTGSINVSVTATDDSASTNVTQNGMVVTFRN